MKILLFDSDGVITISKGLKNSLMQEYSVSEEYISEFFRNDFMPCMRGEIDVLTVLKKYTKKWNWEKSTDELLAYWLEKENQLDQRILSVITYLREEKKIPCYVATNQEPRRLAYMKTVMKYDERFDGIFSSCELGYAKPDILFYESVYSDLSQKFDLEKNDILFIDDREENIHSAREFGFDVFHYESFSEDTCFENFQNGVKTFLKMEFEIR